MKRSAFKMRSGNSTSFKMMGSTSPVKHGKFEDFQYGKKGHNPDTMSAKHEDFHAKQSGKSPIEKKVETKSVSSPSNVKSLNIFKPSKGLTFSNFNPIPFSLQ